MLQLSHIMWLSHTHLSINTVFLSVCHFLPLFVHVRSCIPRATKVLFCRFSKQKRKSCPSILFWSLFLLKALVAFQTWFWLTTEHLAPFMVSTKINNRVSPFSTYTHLDKILVYLTQSGCEAQMLTTASHYQLRKSRTKKQKMDDDWTENLYPVLSCDCIQEVL